MAIDWQAQLDAIELALLSGASEVEYSDVNGSQRTRFRSLEDMLIMRRWLLQKLGLAGRDQVAIQTRYSKGLE